MDQDGKDQGLEQIRCASKFAISLFWGKERENEGNH